MPMGLSLEFFMPLVPHHLEQNKISKNKQAGTDEKELCSVVGLPSYLVHTMSTGKGRSTPKSQRLDVSE